MGNRNVWRLVQIAAIADEPVDMIAGDVMRFVPQLDDVGSFAFGNGTKDMDVKVFLGGAGAYALFDSGASAFTLSGVSATLGTVTLGGAVSLTGKLTPSGSGYVAGKAVVTEATATRTVTAADFDAIIELTKSDGACTVTLPAPSAANAGAVVKIVCMTDQAHVIALANKIIALTAIDADSLTAAETSKVGQAATLESDGAKWVLTSFTGAWTVTAA